MVNSKLIAYCGVDCGQCVDYVSGKCPSCKASQWTNDNICLPVKCCIENKLDHCAFCRAFPCDEMKAFYGESESHMDAYRRMCDFRIPEA